MKNRRGPSMFLRMLVRAAVLRRGRAVAALFAMVVAAAVATAMLTLFGDVQSKLQREFRNYGANVVLVAKDGQQLSDDALKQAESAGLAVPFSYALARASNGQSVVVVGTDFDRARKLNGWWSVSAWPSHANAALVGQTAAKILDADGKQFDLLFQDHPIHLVPAGVLQTGAAEDSRIFISLADFQSWTKLQVSALEVAVPGSPIEVRAAMEKLSATIPSAEVRPVRQLMEGEARVLGKTRSTLLASCVLIIVTAALCVLATLIGWVLDRRRDFAIMKALGASQKLITSFFAAEASLLGVAGAVFGFALGIGAAFWIGRVNFHASIEPRLGLFPVILAGSVAVALVSAIAPISILRRVQPATILRGE
ncbi:MAG TPA: FtsX-like permease family protein [Terriglobales bacterium]|jgi:putative ABC transport system permease protein|nr:FtsX-like permease family protein [Terriglobales bacterium]